MSKVKKKNYLLDFRLTLPFLIHKKIQYNIYVNLLYRLPILKPKTSTGFKFSHMII